jgi:negative regulator of sigma E activity
MVHSTIFSDFFFSIGIDIENGLMEMWAKQGVYNVCIQVMGGTIINMVGNEQTSFTFICFHTLHFWMKTYDIHS